MNKENKPIINDATSIKEDALNFNKYKYHVVRDDIEKWKNATVVRFWHFIPLIGFFWVTYRDGLIFQSIDRGVVRKTYTKIISKWLFCSLFIVAYIWIFLPYLMIPINRKTLRDSQVELKKIAVEVYGIENPEL